MICGGENKIPTPAGSEFFYRTQWKDCFVEEQTLMGRNVEWAAKSTDLSKNGSFVIYREKR